MSNNTKRAGRVAVLTAALLAASLSCGAAFADPTSDKLTRIEEETLLLKARERQLDVQASILSKQGDIAAKQSAISQAAQTQTPKQGDPVLVGVEGIGRAMFATLQLGDGSMVEAQAGDVLANGMRVLSIAPGNVVVASGTKKREKRVRLAQQAPRQSAAYPVLPPPMALPLPMSQPSAAPKGGAR
ncbi:type IV pilus biogenesis protein PilP [Pseudoduganella namucuonensis]|uniref:Type IV pilus biogenesis protein PilP n=1 Tax=Pseudoduganella namucuonensis TaxID=1035707 RepID=A0A1I7L7S6_9BURK|nr:type IV pilus biogenesis protein PilP [Pseudoduganella namucuonensis]SFV05771.1 type IV pilus biogenesis protein PilP [Pseudoduganella namucuonensis]